MNGTGSPLKLGNLPDFSRVLTREEEQLLFGRPGEPTAESLTMAAGSAAPATLLHVKVDRAWQRHDVDGEGIVVAVIDSGCDPANTDLAPRVLAGKAFLGAQDDTQDRFGHGTSVAALIAAADRRGVAPAAKILPLKIYESKENAPDVMLHLAEALEHAVGLDVQVVNISLGNSCNHADDTNLPEELAPIAERISNAIKQLRLKHVPVVVAAGNDYAIFDSAVGMCFPAIIPNVISVGAVHSNNEVLDFTYPYSSDQKKAITVRSSVDVLAPFSQRLPRIVGTTFTRLMAPGAPVSVVGLDGLTRKESGTSLAAPLVTGVIALMQQRYKKLFGHQPTCSQIEDCLTAGARNIDDATGDHVSVTNTGASFPRLDALGALDKIAELNAGS